jgi:two-component system alkaline phosphatase synthesis response regulator PhoP
MSAPAATARSCRTILVADDDPDLLMLMQIRLTNAGYNFVGAPNGRQALDRIAKSQPDMVILDVMMPELTGTEVLERLRADPATKDLLVVLMSASFIDATGDVDASTCADDYIAKPFHRGEPQSRVDALFERSSLGDATP